MTPRKPPTTKRPPAPKPQRPKLKAIAVPVTVTFNGHITVMALDEADAIEKAREKYRLSDEHLEDIMEDVDIDYDFACDDDPEAVREYNEE